MLPPACICVSLVVIVLFPQMDTVPTNPDQGLWDLKVSTALELFWMLAPSTHTHMPTCGSIHLCL